MNIKNNLKWFSGHFTRSGRPPSGGLVKLEHLRAYQKEDPVGFRILYLVSSTLDRYSTFWRWYAKTRGVPVVVNQNGVAYPGWAPHNWKRINLPLKRNLRAAQWVVYQSRFCQESADHFLGAVDCPSEVLYNPVNLSHFSSIHEFNPRSPLVLLLGGSQYQAYRLKAALEVLVHLKKMGVGAQLLVTGKLCWDSEAHCQDLANQWLRAMKLQHDKEVIFIGAYTQQQAPNIYRRAHILLHTKYNDPSPGLIGEALACGLPIVYSKSGGTPELVGPEAGIGIETEQCFDRDIPPDPEKMANAVLKVLDNLSDYRSAALERSRVFCREKWVERHLEIFTGLVGES